MEKEVIYDLISLKAKWMELGKSDSAFILFLMNENAVIKTTAKGKTFIKIKVESLTGMKLEDTDIKVVYNKVGGNAKRGKDIL